MSFRAGQTATATPTVQPAVPVPVPAAPPASPVSIGPNGYISNIDGMLSQVSGALMREAKVHLLPELQQDKALQETVGRAIGREIAKPLWIGAIAITAAAAVVIWNSSSRRRENPRRGRRR
jgi:hypothetical protein